MEKISKLTPEQEAKLEVYKQLYLDKFFNNKEETDVKKLEEYVHWLYSFAGLEVPEQIIVVDSPMAILQKYKELTNASKLEWLDVNYYLSAFNSWVSFYDYFGNEILQLNEQELFDKYKQILDLNIFWGVTMDKVCIVSRNAIRFERNAQFQLHSVEGSAIEFLDGYEMFFIRGLGISKELFEKLNNKQYTMEDFSKEGNEELKSAAVAFMEEKFGNEYVVNFFKQNLKEIDTYVDKKSEEFLEHTTKSMNVGVYTLFKGKINGTDVGFVRCYCPSTDRMFFLGVDSKHKNSKDAIASLYRVPTKLKPHIKSISRQGERFSTTFTDEGMKILKKLSKDEIENLTSITGEEYFKLMKYEF